MAGKISTIAPLPFATPTFTQVSYTTATAYPCGISRDRLSVFGGYGASPNNLYETVDDGTAWTLVHTFSGPVTGFVETEDGEALVVAGTKPSCQVYKSSGWAASHTAATWTSALTVPTTIRPIWGLNRWSFGEEVLVAGSSRYGVCSEYGDFTNGTTDTVNKSTRAYFTQNYGATWTEVINLASRYPGVIGMSILTTAYDAFWDRIWLIYEDSSSIPPTEVGNVMILYSDDHGATWTSVPAPSDLDPTPNARWSGLSVMEDCIVLHSAHRQGIWRMSRRGYRQIAAPQLVQVTHPHTSDGMIANGSYRAPGVPGAPLLLAAQQQSTAEDTVPYIQMTTDGLTFVELWRDTSLRNVGSAGPYDVYGPTAGGKLLARVDVTGSSSFRLLVGEFFSGETEIQRGGIATFSGDAVTTAFLIPHGLGVAPTRVTAEAGSAAAAAAFFATVDATNITVTFTVAPAAVANNVVVNWTAGV